MTKQIKTQGYYWLNGKRRYLAKMHECPHGEKHEPMEGVLYRRCKKCGNLYAVRDEMYIQETGEKSFDE